MPPLLSRFFLKENHVIDKKIAETLTGIFFLAEKKTGSDIRMLLKFWLQVVSVAVMPVTQMSFCFSFSRVCVRYGVGSVSISFVYNY